MCKTKKDAQVSNQTPNTSTRASIPSSPSLTFSTSFPNTHNTNTSSSSFSSSSLITSFLEDGPILFSFPELSTATNNFLSSPLSSSSFRCTLRSTDSVILRRPFSGDPDTIPSLLSSLAKSHHRSIARLIGASITANHIFLVYKYIPGVNLNNALRNPRNPSFTILSTWLSRVQVAADLAQGLEYMHHQSSTIHNRFKSSGVIITEPDLHAKICHFGAAELAGEVCSSTSPVSNKLKRLGSQSTKIDGTRGYIAPEVLAGGSATQKSDVFAFGVVLLEIVSGEEPIKYRMDKETRDYVSTSVIEMGRKVIGEEEEEQDEERRRRVRRWVDRRLRDSFPEEVAEKLIRVALKCVDEEVGMRPDMVWVAGKVSRMFLESEAWGEKVSVPTGISVSFAPR